MFPSLRISLSELDPAQSYCVMVEMALTSNTRYKFNGKNWTSSGAAEPQSFQRFYLHPDSPASGAHWMEQPLSFNKIKLTNNQLDKYGHVSSTPAPPLSLSRLVLSQKPEEMHSLTLSQDQRNQECNLKYVL